MITLKYNKKQRKKQEYRRKEGKTGPAGAEPPFPAIHRALFPAPAAIAPRRAFLPSKTARRVQAF
jgi:hypothetical protein